jgi:hypothetical protein
MTVSGSEAVLRPHDCHPPGAVRLVTPAEEEPRRRAPAVRLASLTSTSRIEVGTRPTWLHGVAGTLRRLARVWVEAQVHKLGV